MSTRFKSHEAAAYLGYADPTLRESRVTGKLAGVDAPRYQKIGARVFYDKDVLDAWLGQFPMTRHTSEYRMQKPADGEAKSRIADPGAAPARAGSSR